MNIYWMQHKLTLGCNRKAIPNKKLAIVDYHYHNDLLPNSDMSSILSAKPDILIDNTPGGLWHGGTLPSKYSSSKIRVFSYITSGYEGTKYGSSEDNLTANISRIDAIANDGAAGVFVDEVSSFPDVAGITYLRAICVEAHARGLLVIFNTGENNFDDWLYTAADYICSNEAYVGDVPNVSEKQYLSRTIVIDLDPGMVASTAIAITKKAFANGYGWAYVTNDYNNLPVWLAAYVAGI
jgi:hypothetical protein